MTADAAEVRVREERPGDEEAIAALVASAFAGLPHAGGNEAGIVEGLRNAGALAVSLVAESEDRLVGHVAFSPVRVASAERGWFGLGPLAVAPAWQRRGIGSALVRAGLDRLRTGGARGCVVLGDPAYYGRFGFIADARLRFAAAPAEYFQMLCWEAQVPSGRVDYHAAFDG